MLLIGGTLGLNTVVAQFTAAQNTAGNQTGAQARLARARALAASNNLAAATRELEEVRKAATDEVLRNGTGLMLLTLYFEQANYAGAISLLDEAFAARNKNADVYFTTAGQAVRGVRARLERYRTFNLNVTAADLPREAIDDLNGMRGVLERLADQSNTFSNESLKNFEARLLLEDVAGLQSGLARNTTEKARWTGILSNTRQRMVESDGRIKANETLRREETAPTANPNNSSTIARNTPAPQRPVVAPPPTAPASAGASMRPVSVPQPDEEVAPANPAPTRIERTVTPPPVTRPANRNPPPAPSPKPVEQPTPVPVAPVVAPVRQTVALASGQLLDVGSLTSRAAQRPNPTYPAMARTARVSGTVKVYLEVDENGNAVKIKSSEGHALLQRAAEDAARRWKFNQTVIDGQAVRVTGFLVFNFVL